MVIVSLGNSLDQNLIMIYLCRSPEFLHLCCTRLVQLQFGFSQVVVTVMN